MEAQTMPGPNGTPAHFPSPAGQVAAAPGGAVRLLGIILRGLAIVLTLLATIVMGVAKQSKMVDFQRDDYGNLLFDKRTAKSTDFSALQYFIAANAIAFVFSSLSLVMTIANKSNTAAQQLLSIVDHITAALLYSCNGAAMTIVVLANKDIEKYQWFKFCNVISKFCGHLTAAVVLSIIAAVAFTLLHLISVIGSHNK